MVKRLFVLGMLPFVGSLTLVACDVGGVFESGDQRATEEAQSTARGETAVFAGTQAGTVVALQETVDNAVVMQTQLAQLQIENQILQDTVEAVLTFGAPVLPRYTPTPTRLVEISTPRQSISESFEAIQTTLEIDTETGCGLQKQGRFSVNAPIVYLTAVAQNVIAGTAHETRWYFGDELRYTSDPWIADQDYEETCVFFWIDQTSVTFEPGLWSVELFLEDNFIVSVPFELCEAGELC